MASSGSIVGFDPSDPTQQSFLSALGSVENSSANPLLGYGNVNLSGAPTDAYGFPIWGGDSTASGATHAAGLFQFQPATFDALASTYNLNFQNPADQEAAAWYQAQQTYGSTTGGNLSTVLATAAQDEASGNQAGAAGIYNQIATALGGQWQGLLANGSQFVNVLQTGQGGAPLPGITANSAAGSGASGTGSSSSGSSSWVATIENFFVRFGLIIVGGLIVLVALWQLISSQTSLPSPSQTAKAAAAIV